MKIPVIKKWHRCDLEQPDKDGNYIFCRINEEGTEITYITITNYTHRWGWNTDEFSKDAHKFEYIEGALWAEYEIIEEDPEK